MTMQYRATASAGGGLKFVLSDASMDRHGTRIDPKGWDTSEFNKNPIALFAHRSEFPIGRWKNVRPEGGKLVGELVLAEKGTSARIDELISLVEQGILRAVSVGFEPLEFGKPGDDFEIKRQSLLETSLVAVPSNKNALAMARSLNISDETLSLAFGEQAIERREDRTTTGEQADTTPLNVQRTRAVLPATPRKPKTMSNLSQRIEDTQNDLNAKRDRLVELSAVSDIDLDAVEELNTQIETAERTLATLKVSEARIGVAAAGVAAPAVARRPLGFSQAEVKPADLIIRSALAHLVAHTTGKDIERVLEDRYPGHEATAVVTRADATVATTTTSGWASQLVNTALQDLLTLLSPMSVFPGLSAKGVHVTFNNSQGAITIPSTSTDAALAGGFVLEGDPIPVGRQTFTSISMAPHKFGIITTFTKEAASYTTPALESVLRNSILRRTAITLDGLLLDATAGTTTRPAGLLNGVSAVATGYGGGDYAAFLADVNALMAPFDTANAGRSMVLIMHPAQARKIAMMPGPDGVGFGWADRFLSQFTILTSTSATAARLIAIDAEDFASAAGAVPMFEVSDQAVLHMSDSPAEIVAANGTVADPIRSMFQTNSLALKMVLPLTWKMRRSGMIQWIDSTSY